MKYIHYLYIILKTNNFHLKQTNTMKASNNSASTLVGNKSVGNKSVANKGSKGSKVVIDPSVFADDSTVGMVTAEEVEKPKRAPKVIVEKIDKRAIKKEALRLTLERINEIVQAQPHAKAQYLVDNNIEKSPKLDSKSFDLFVLLRENFGFSNIIHYMKKYKDQTTHWSELQRVKDVYFAASQLA